MDYNALNVYVQIMILIAISLSGLATFFSYRVMRRQVEISVLPRVSVVIKRDHLFPYEGFQVDIKNLGTKSISIRNTISYSLDKKTWLDAKHVYGGAANIELQPKGELRGMLIWKDHFSQLTWRELDIQIREAHVPIYLRVNAEASTIGVKNTTMKLPVSHYIIRGHYNIQIEPVFGIYTPHA